MKKFILIFFILFSIVKLNIGHNHGHTHMHHDEEIIEEDEIPDRLEDDDGDDSSEQVQEVKESPYVPEEDENDEDDQKLNERLPMHITDIKKASIAFIIAFICLIILWLVVLHIMGYNKVKFPGKNRVVLCGNRKSQPNLRDVEANHRSQDPLNDALFMTFNQKYNEATKLLWTNPKTNTLSDKSSSSNGSKPIIRQ